MQFRTEIETPARPVVDIRHDTPMLMLGSCFTDNVGAKLVIDGFKAVHNPMGTLYNPASILAALQLAAGDWQPMYREHNATWHCMNFATRYTSPDLEALQSLVMTDLTALRSVFEAAKVVIFTLGTAFVFETSDTHCVVGNCHKLPPVNFNRRRMEIDEICSCLDEILDLCRGKQVIFTVSPIRHTADTLHGNQLSKASLLLAIDKVRVGRADSAQPPLYFPAYEIMLDDLRDYRFYASDMKHPSEVAVDYIYDIFADYYFTARTRELARESRKEWLRSAHVENNPK